MQLETLTGEAKPTQTERPHLYSIGDLESLSATALYYGIGGSPLGNVGSFGIVRTPKGFVVPMGNLGIEELKDVHDTYKTDEDGNVSYGHTTFVSDKGTRRISHDDK